MIKVSVDCADATITEDDRHKHSEATGRRKPRLSGNPRARQVSAARQTGCVRTEKSVANENHLIYVTREEKECLRGSW